ncbi:hypothetical protein N9N18_03040 [Euryarchaeota archaeon]|nr:hypothetical protein [Euryarchaeota archaeon]
MSNDKYLKYYLEFDDEWPLSLVSIDAPKMTQCSPQFTCMAFTSPTKHMKISSLGDIIEHSMIGRMTSIR